MKSSQVKRSKASRQGQRVSTCGAASESIPELRKTFLDGFVARKLHFRGANLFFGKKKLAEALDAWPVPNHQGGCV
ncbi:hypothetical protein DNTS_020219 [Danionella cerebrum]|uniref:Uncharacterized protein n=1 Tax=Danionella cerebrum TaxID=2873325 RepID=A0A553P5M3_9TELE|nr:hypothetical protein DNTS_020219 [Danionella translucida]